METLEIKISIKSCRECKHITHSGSFTKGGSKPVCGHSAAVELSTKDKNANGDDRHHWKHRVIPYKMQHTDTPRGGTVKTGVAKSTIPKWCPLKNGYGY